jgi:glucose/arabinose dehydrogenase
MKGSDAMQGPPFLIRILALPLVVACSEDQVASHKDAGMPAPTTTSTQMPSSSAPPTTTAPPDAQSPPPMKDFCSLPGSIVFDESGRHVVGTDTGQLSWLTLQKGFCAHHFAKLPSVRELRFGPHGELFGSSPGQTCVGGATAGLGAIVMIPDDDRDGVGDTPIQILSNLQAAHGFTFAPGAMYFQATVSQIRKVPYDGSRTPIGNGVTAGEAVADITVYESMVHWGKTMDIADDGSVYVTNGGDLGNECSLSRAIQGAIFKIDGSPGGHLVAQGFRNPVRLRCQRGHDTCFALELGPDGSGSLGGREKLLVVRDGDDWGLPCCASKGVPFQSFTPVPDCSKIASEENSFAIGNTPFGFDFVPSTWPAPYAGGFIVTLHGGFGTWTGARVVAIAGDPITGRPLKTSTIGDVPTGPISDFATGWDDRSNAHGRPTVAAFGPDGRLYIGDDTASEIFWVAPIVR